MNIYRINTTAYNEEDFFIQSTLTEMEIIKVINPIVMMERNGDDEYDNDTLVDALIKAYPKDKILPIKEFKKISI
jgi:hypothetical protein